MAVESRPQAGGKFPGIGANASDRIEGGGLRGVFLFLILVVVISWGAALPWVFGKARVLLSFQAMNASPFFWVWAAAPALASGITAVLVRDAPPWRFRWKIPPRWVLLSILLPAIWTAAILLLGAETRLSEWPVRGIRTSPAIRSVLVDTAKAGLVLALLQETGWRGYLLPRLLRYGRMEASLVTGAVWALCSAPILLMSPLHGAAPEGVRYAALAIQIVLLSFILTWIYCGSGRSLAVCVLAHAFLWTAAGRATRPELLDGMPILVAARGILGSMFLVIWIWWLYVRGAFQRPTEKLWTRRTLLRMGDKPEKQATDFTDSHR